MFRIHFTAEDLVRTRVTQTWGPLAETIFSLATMRRGKSETMFAGWRQRVSQPVPPEMRPMMAVSTDPPWDLFTTTGPIPTMQHGLEALMDIPARHFQAEIGDAQRFAAEHLGRQWPKSDVGNPATKRHDRHRLAHGWDTWYQRAVAPHWPQIRGHLDAEHARRMRVIADGGVEQLLATLSRDIRWRPPTLELTQDPRADFHLGGRGLLLIPSVFCTKPATPYFSSSDDSAPVILFYPALREPADALRLWTPTDAPTQSALTTLLGRTRAHALEAIASGCTTTELARRIRVSLPTASQHASVLREAGLVTTQRHGTAVLHNLTLLGMSLLNGGSPQ